MFSLSSPLAPWFMGEDLDILAPFSGPRDLLTEDPVLFLVPRDEDALALATAVGACLVLRTTPRSQRAWGLEPDSGPKQVVTSVDALSSPILAREVQDIWAEGPLCLWWPEATLHGQPGHGGRGRWLARLRSDLRGPLLRRWSDGALAPKGAVEVPGTPGALRWGEAASGVIAGRSLVRGAVPESWLAAAARAGQARRRHELERPFPRAWRGAEDALRGEPAGVDILPAVGPAAPLGATVLPAAPAPWALAVPHGAALGWGGQGPVAPAAPLGEDRGPAATTWSVDAGGAATLEDWEARGAVRDLRPTWLEALVADHHRFCLPFVEREPEYLRLHLAYTTALGILDLRQRAALVLSDRGPRDLVALAEALELDPAWLANVLLALADDGLIACSLRPRAPGADWAGAARSGAPVGEASSGSDEALASSPAASRAAPLLGEGPSGSDEALASLIARPGCRAQALAEALRVSDPGPCGRCDRCDPGEGWRESVEVLRPSASARLGSAPPRPVAPSLGSLFSGLGGGPSAPSVRPAPSVGSAPRPAAEREAPDLGMEADDAALDDAEALGFSPSSLWVAAAWQHRPPMPGRPLPAEARAALLAALAGEEAPGVTAQDGGRRWTVYVTAGPFRGMHQLRRRSGGDRLLRRLALREEPPGPLRAVLRVREAEERRVLDRDLRLRASILEKMGAGDLSGAFSALSDRIAPPGPGGELSTEEAAAFGRLRREVAAQQRSYTPRLARALSAGALLSGAAGEAGMAALREAEGQGWGRAIVELLRGQSRQHPGDPARRAWLGRALLVAGRDTEARKVLLEADRLLGGDVGLDLLWEAVEARLQGPPEGALRWLEAAVRRGPPAEVARRLAVLAWGDGVPEGLREPLLQLVRGQGGGLWEGALRALEARR